ncbi:hypothetical protein EYZ11_001545 [Aspergillus tanneri]|uniref:Uncharacterized protein n=1 Tax=Aspergillus tanneri TaxID=1220188 RepID=A0A4S3JUD3_9EURO|nr:uncharacterized protein ATNIH1004_007564 [Aspergillus tanneri]KAA8646138.1 hypothetical protein ATNIH1004_007564 [Aspergillus tanneri]THC98994.1 hypothetical protein EYZ11_001545 [Aspergillus tanneri]
MSTSQDRPSSNRDSHSHSHRPRSDSRSRSRSPDRRKRHHHHCRHYNGHRHRHSHHDRHNRHHDHDRHEGNLPVVVLPFQARELSKRDLALFEPMFAMYLDIQKGLILEELSEEEVKGRWKSFMGKWNRGELAEGWYDPNTLERARRDIQTHPAPHPNRGSPDYGDQSGKRDESLDLERRTRESDVRDGAEDDDDEYGPDLPYGHGAQKGQLSGPAIPTMQDLELRNEFTLDEAIVSRQDAQKHRRAELRAHRSELRHIEDEVAPRAEPGTHERRMEKRKEAAAANRAFAETRRGGSPTDAAPEEELMGSGTNDFEAMKKDREREQRKKNEREIRREEILRARAAEREERLQQYRRKEDETIGWLKTLAKQRFG